MIILGIETSCDETAAAVVQKSGDRVEILSNVIASSAELQAKYGGVIPEQAAREQIKSIISVIEEALKQAFPKSRLPRRSAPRNDIEGIDAIAVTYGPGLIGSLLVGVETAKVLAKVWNKPLIPINHLLGHFYANWITNQSSAISYQLSEKKQKKSDDRRLTTDDYPEFPCIGLLVSGGHTDLVLFTGHGKYEYLGGTRDDAAGECFDKCARLLNLPYPGGPYLAKLASKGNALRFKLPRPMITSKNFDFSFSGLKTAVANLIEARGDSEKGILTRSRSERSRTRMHGGISSWQDPERLADLAASIEQAIVDVLVTKTIRATQQYKVKQIIVAGGVAANQKLTSDLKFKIDGGLFSSKIKNLKLKIKLHVPPQELCTDNAAMVATAAFFNYKSILPDTLQANPNLNLT